VAGNGHVSSQDALAACAALVNMASDMIGQLCWIRLDMALYDENRQLREVFYDPVFARSKRGDVSWFFELTATVVVDTISPC